MLKSVLSKWHPRRMSLAPTLLLLFHLCEKGISSILTVNRCHQLLLLLLCMQLLHRSFVKRTQQSGSNQMLFHYISNLADLLKTACLCGLMISGQSGVINRDALCCVAPIYTGKSLNETNNLTECDGLKLRGTTCLRSGASGSCLLV